MQTSSCQEIGRYTIDKLLGQGSMGKVYLARDYRLHRQVAIKTIRLKSLETEEQRLSACKLFLTEARIAAKLSHGHITTVYDMGVHQGIPYLVMEYINGDNLKMIMANRSLEFTCREKLSTIALLANALHYAHQRHVLHRDIKPSNIMITKNGTPKITDFGIASLMGLGEQSGDDEAEYQLMGTPQYMSPEHIRGRGFDARSDIFSLGILAYEWLSGNKPFIGKSQNEILQQIISDPPPLLTQTSLVDNTLEAIILKALTKRPEERYQSAEEFSDALELYVDSLEEDGTEVIANAFSDNRGEILERLRKKYLFFADFSDEELLAIFRLSQKRTYETGEYIIREGTVGSRMYVILSGSVSVQTESDGREVEIERLESGNCVGEMSLVDRMPRSASVVALEPCVAIAINDTVLRHSNPHLCLKFYRNLAAMLSERLRINDQRHKELR